MPDSGGSFNASARAFARAFAQRRRQIDSTHMDCVRFSGVGEMATFVLG
jgi:hypothetical protein